MTRAPSTMTPLAQAPLIMAAKLVASPRERDLVMLIFSDPQLLSIPEVETRAIDGQSITVIRIVRRLLPSHRLELHLERNRCALVEEAISDGVPTERVVAEGTARDLLAQRRMWPACGSLLDDLDVAWESLLVHILMRAQDQSPLFHLYGRTRGQSALVPLPFRFAPWAIDWPEGTVTEPSSAGQPGRARRVWQVFVRYVGDRERPAVRVRAEKETALTDWLTREMMSAPYLPMTFADMQARVAARHDPPSGEMLRRAWKKALGLTRATFPDTAWGRTGPRGPRVRRPVEV